MPFGFLPATATQSGSAPLNAVAWVALALAFACAGYIAWDIFVRGNRQKMAIMNAVYPITALYWGPVAVWLYRRGGPIPEEGESPRRLVPFSRANWWPVSKGVAHCGAGCTLGDIIGEWVVFATAWTIPIFGVHAADSLMAMFAADFVAAWTLGIVFQYFSIVPMRDDLGRLAGVRAAIKADTLSIVAFQVGLFGFMALYHLVLFDPPLATDTAAYWFFMQIGMIIGFFTAWPVNAWLVRRGVKERM
jgi:hypothetical protein